MSAAVARSPLRCLAAPTRPTTTVFVPREPTAPRVGELDGIQLAGGLGRTMLCAMAEAWTSGTGAFSTSWGTLHRSSPIKERRF